jgi:hypothetical protein
MRKHYDFSNAVRNPHAGKFRNGYTIVIEHKDYDEVITVTKTKRPKDENGATSPNNEKQPALNT